MTATQAPITQASARIAIQNLIDKFNQDRKRDDYNEQQTREYFILPLFRALGWNTEDPAEFSAEEQISRGRVDFGFYRHGVPVFYLETKRVAERLENPKFIRQAINYAYLRGVTWAVLCDFEQILVYNAQWETNDLQKARFLRLNYSDYADKDFDDLWLLSKPAFMTNALDRQAEKYGKKAIRRPVTEILFQQLTDWRKQLFTEFRAFGGIFATDTSRVDNAVQRLIDRLIFIRSMEDRGIESRLLQSLVRVAKTEKRNPYLQLQKLFADLDKSYNSNIFATSDLDQLKFTDAVLIEGIIDGLYGNQTSIEYDFNAISADVLGAVYEQYLSFKAQDPHGEQSAKSQKRKSQGIYYTPQFIVRYIIQHTLGVALKNGIDPLKIRVLDPACGSGSFLIEAFDFLDRWITRSHPNIPASQRRDHILQHNLYGVDLDVQAVEVTRLNLLLRAAYERRLLPPLTHIRHGDSLITPNFDYHTAFDEVFADGGFDVVVGNPPYVRQETLGADFKEYVAKNYAVYAGTADLYVYFIERGLSLLKDGGGLGYILPNKWMRANYGKALRAFLDEKHISRVVDFGTLDVFPNADVNASLLFLANDTPNEDFYALDAQTYSKHDELSDFSDKHQFTISRNYLRNDGWSLATNKTQVIVNRLMNIETTVKDVVKGNIYWGIKTGYDAGFVINLSQKQNLIRNDLRSQDLIKPFLTVNKNQPLRYYPPQTEKFIILIPNGWTRAQMAELSDDANMPVRAQHVAPLHTLSSAQAWDWLRATYPAIATHLEPFRDRAEKRSDKGEFWWELRPCAYYDEFEKPKIVYQRFQVKPSFTVDKHGYYMNDAIWMMVIEDYFLLGILNSNIGWFQIQHTCTQIQNGYQLIWTYLKNLQIPTASETDRARLIALVQQQLSNHAQIAGLSATESDTRFEVVSAIAKTDKQINALVAGLYGVDEADVTALG